MSICVEMWAVDCIIGLFCATTAGFGEWALAQRFSSFSSLQECVRPRIAGEWAHSWYIIDTLVPILNTNDRIKLAKQV